MKFDFFTVILFRKGFNPLVKFFLLFNKSNNFLMDTKIFN